MRCTRRGTCQRRGNFLCAACMSADEGRIVSSACVGRTVKPEAGCRAIAAPMLSGLALVLTAGTALAGVPLGCSLSLVEVGIGLAELRAIRLEHSSPRSRRPALLGVARGLGAIAAAVALSIHFGPRDL